MILARIEIRGMIFVEDGWGKGGGAGELVSSHLGCSKVGSQILCVCKVYVSVLLPPPKTKLSGVLTYRLLTC